MTKWTTADIPDQTGRTAVITGANTGLGYETAAALAAKGAHVVLAVRNLDKGKQAADRIDRATPGANVARPGTRPHLAGVVRAAADELKSALRQHRPADQQRRRDVYAEGDHQGRLRACSSAPIISATSRFTGLLLDRVLAAPGSRVVTVSSTGHRFARRHPLRRPAVGAQLQPRRRLRPVEARQPVFTYELQRRLARHQHHRRRRAPRRLQHRTDPQPARRVQRALRPHCAAALPERRRWAHCRRCGPPPIPACSAGSTSALRAFGEQRGYPKSSRPASSPTTSTSQQRLWTVSEELTKVVFPVG